MDKKDTLLRLAPKPPDWGISWAALQQTSLGVIFSQMAVTPQNPQYHGEGDVLTHTQMVCQALIKLDDFRQLDEMKRGMVFFAALLHDIGKISCTRLEDGKWTAPHHATTGAAMARELLWLNCGWCGEPHWQTMRETICTLIRYHSLPAHAVCEKDGEQRLLRVAANGELLPDFSVKLLCLLSKADILGRVCSDQTEMVERVDLCGVMAEELGCLTEPRVFPSRHTAFSYFSGRLDQPDCVLYDDTWGEVVLMCGLPGTGKDTWIAHHCAELPVVSLDAIRTELGIPPMGPQRKVADEARERARILLRQKKSFIWNATNITTDFRQRLVQLFAAYHASVHIVYLETEWQEELRRNVNRAAVVPESDILRMLSSLMPPEAFEAHRVDWFCI